MKVYLAGKINFVGDWRDDIVDGLFDHDKKHPTTFVPEDDYYAYGVHFWPTMQNSIPGGHDYIGPYYIRDNHWCANNKHGLYVDNKHDVFIACLSAINEADIIFAWIAMDEDDHSDAITAYGTIAELGIAFALGKEIYIAGDKEYDDLWFVYQLAKKTLFGIPARDAFIKLVPPEKLNYYAYIRSPEWKQKAEAAKERVGQRCQLCNRPRNEVTLDAHHRTYERLGDELPEDITVLCRDCHQLYETNKKDRNHG